MKPGTDLALLETAGAEASAGATHLWELFVDLGQARFGARRNSGLIMPLLSELRSIGRGCRDAGNPACRTAVPTADKIVCVTACLTALKRLFFAAAKFRPPCAL